MRTNTLTCRPKKKREETGQKVFTFSFLIIFEGIRPFFLGALIPFLWTSCDVCPGFQNPHLRDLLPACEGFLRFTSGASPPSLLEASIAAEPF